jgi:hypothetical protein
MCSERGGRKVREGHARLGSSRPRTKGHSCFSAKALLLRGTRKPERSGAWSGPTPAQMGEGDFWRGPICCVGARPKRQNGCA